MDGGLDRGLCRAHGTVVGDLNVPAHGLSGEELLVTVVALIEQEIREAVRIGHLVRIAGQAIDLPHPTSGRDLAIQLDDAGQV